MRFRYIGAFIAALFLGSVAIAQETKGALEGVLKDDTGGVLPGATVEIKSLKLGTVQTAFTDSAGIYRFPAVSPGGYDVTATMQGFSPAGAKGIEVRLGQTMKVDLTLRVGDMTAELIVTDEIPLIDTKGSGSAVSIRDEQISKLPRGRDFTTVATQAASTNNETDLGGLSIDGASGAENRYIIDGLDTTNIQTGQSGKNLITDFVDEVQVKSSGYAAEYGGATGGVINVITKSGGNAWAGSVGAYYSSSGLEGEERPTLRLVPDDQTDDNVVDGEYITYAKDSFNRLEPGLALGGALVKDRAWFFAGYQPSLRQTDRSVGFSGGTPQPFAQKVQVHYATVNLTGQISSKLRGRLSGSFSPELTYGELPARDGTGNPVFDYPSLGGKKPNSSWSGSLDLSATNSLYLGLRGGYFSYNDKDVGVPNEIWYNFFNSNQSPAMLAKFPEIPASLRRSGGFSSVPTNAASTLDEQTRRNLSFDTTYFANMGGDHAFKAGVQVDRIGNNVFSGYQKPRFRYIWDQALNKLDGTSDRGKYGYYRVFSITTEGDVKSNNVGLYLQDAWTISDRLTINAGVRTESEKVPSFRTDLGQAENAIDFGFGDKVAPRIGFAYDIKGDGTWKAFGSWGVFYDITKLEMPRGSFGGDRWLDYRYSLDSFDWLSIGATAGCPPACPGRFLEVVDFRHPANSADAFCVDPNDPSTCSQTIDPDLKPMKSQEFAFGLQRKINNATSIALSYKHKQLDRTIEDVGIIVPGVGEVFFIANPGYGLAEYTIGRDFPAQPPATRKYDAVELEFTRRMSNRWSLHGSYLWSRLHGNYSGLASSDENGRSSPNVNRFFDGIIMSFDQNGQPVYGKLGTDRTHQFKAQALYDFPWGLSIGLNQTFQSGTPITRQAAMQSSLPVLYLGRGSDGRTPMLSQTDLALQHEFRLGDGSTFQLSVNVENLFDQDTAKGIFSDETNGNLAVSDEEFFAGFNAAQKILEQANEHVIAYDGRFLKADVFQERRKVRLGLKYSF